MYISDLKLINYRNYKNEKMEFINGINIFIGGNAQGKTNLLESIYYCSRGNSFKSVKDSDIIRHNCDRATLDAQIIRNDRRKLIHIEIGKEKIITINDLRIKSLKDMKSHFDIVYFWPDHLRVVKDGPSLRRELVDDAITTIRPSFNRLHNTFTRLISQRNSLLKKSQTTRYFKEQLISITKQIAEIGAVITIMRHKYVTILKGISSKIHSEITGNSEELDMVYMNSLPDIELISIEREELTGLLYEKIMSSLETDLRYGHTSNGPHRDDLELLINGKDSKIFASQGQQRSIILSIKLAEMDIVNRYNNSWPILLLDDVFSELDKNRRQRFLEKISNCQSLITTNEVNADELNYFSKNINIKKINEGRIVNR